MDVQTQPFLRVCETLQKQEHHIQIIEAENGILTRLLNRQTRRQMRRRETIKRIYRRHNVQADES